MYTPQFSENIVTISSAMQEQMANSHNSNNSSELLDSFPDTVEGYMEEYNISHHMKETTQQQIEYYFSPVNLPSDSQLQAKIDRDGFFSAVELASFPKVTNLTMSLDSNRRIRFIMLLCIQSPQMEVDEAMFRVKSIDHALFTTDTLVIRNVVVGSTEEEIKGLFKNPIYPQCSSCYPLGEGNNAGGNGGGGVVVTSATVNVGSEKGTSEWVLGFSSVDDAMRMYQLMTKRAINHVERSLFVRFKLKGLTEEMLNYSSATTSPFYTSLNNIIPSRPESQHGSEWSYSVETPIQHPSIIQAQQQPQQQQQQQQLDSNINNNIQQLQLQQPQPHYIYPATPLALAPTQAGIALAAPNNQQQLRQPMITPANQQATPTATQNIQLVPQNLILPNGAQYLWPPYVYDTNGLVQFPFHGQPQVVAYDLSRIAGLQLPMNNRLRTQPTLIVGQPSTTILQQQQHQYQHQVYNNNTNNAQINQHATISLINNNNSNNNQIQQQQQHSNNSSNSSTYRQPRRDADRRQTHRYNNRNFNNNNSNNFHQQTFQQQQPQQNSFLQQPPPQLPSQSYVFPSIATHLQQQPHQQQQQLAVTNRSFQLVAISRPNELSTDNTHATSNTNDNNNNNNNEDSNQAMPSNNNSEINNNNNSNNRFPNEYNRQHNIQHQQQQQNRTHYNNNTNNRNSTHNQPQQNAPNPPNNTNNNANTLPRQHQQQHQQQQQQHVTYQQQHQHPTTFHNPHFHGNHFQMPLQQFHQPNNNWKPFPNGQSRYGGYSRGGRRGGRIYEENFNRNNPRSRPHQSQNNDFLENSVAFPPLAAPTENQVTGGGAGTATEAMTPTVADAVGEVPRPPQPPPPSSSSSSSSHQVAITELMSGVNINEQTADPDKKLSYAQIAQKGKEVQNNFEGMVASGENIEEDEEEDDGENVGDDDDTKAADLGTDVDVAVKSEQQQQQQQHSYQHHHHHHQPQNYHRRSQNYYSQQQQQQQQNTFRRGGGAMTQWVGRGRNNNNNTNSSNKERIQQQ